MISKQEEEQARLSAWVTGSAVVGTAGICCRRPMVCDRKPRHGKCYYGPLPDGPLYADEGFAPSSPAGLPHSIETFSGRFVDTKNPDPASIVLEDVAHALAAICRFGGHCRQFFSVAEHAVNVSRRMEERGHSRAMCLAGLHHDDTEAFLVDIPRPLKPLLGPAYTRLSDRMDEAIVQGLDLPFGAASLHSPLVKEADNYALVIEAHELMPSKGAHWFEDEVYVNLWEIGLNPGDVELPDYWCGGLTPAEAEGLYLSRHWELV